MNQRHDTPRMEDMPAQAPARPLGATDARARYFNSGNAFNVVLPAVPAATFMPFNLDAQTRVTHVQLCDQANRLACDVPSTTPLMLAAYESIAPGDAVDTAEVTLRASGSLWYVIDGEGECVSEATSREAFRWSTGDVFMLPGGAVWTLQAGTRGALLWRVDNSPQLAHERVVPKTGNLSGTLSAVHYPAQEIERQLDTLFATTADASTSGFALVFSSDTLAESRNVLPTLTLSLNTLPAGEVQRAHRHNSAAITLVLAGEACHTRVDGARVEWQRFKTLVTPAGALHSHHNEGHGERARFLIVQDGALYYHCRTMGFAFEGE